MGYGRRIAIVAAVSVLVAAGMVWGAQGRSLKVTVSYAGSGEVSATNAIYLSVWDSPDFGGGTAPPLATLVVQENGGAVTFDFERVTASPVYVTALYDERGGWDQESAPSGMFGFYSTDGFGTPAAV
jgi:hypothetical protein